MVSRTEVLAVAGGLAAAGVLFALVSLYNFSALLALPAPVLLVIVAFVYFRGKHPGSVALAGFLAWILCIQVVRASSEGGHGTGMGELFEAVLFKGPLISLGAFCVTLALRIVNKRVRQVFDFALLASIVIGASSLAIEMAQRRRIETQQLPALVKRIYEAEAAYSAGRPDKAFTCDVTQLPAVSALGWTVYKNPGHTVAWLYPSHSRVEMDCFEATHRFRLQAWYENDNRLITFFSKCPCTTVSISVNESGELAVTPVRAD